jgi:hypothetical protein
MKPPNMGQTQFVKSRLASQPCFPGTNPSATSASKSAANRGPIAQQLTKNIFRFGEGIFQKTWFLRHQKS